MYDRLQHGLENIGSQPIRTNLILAGHHHHIQHLWAYFAIGQILPISFAQNLFSIALLLSPVPPDKRNNFNTPIKEGSLRPSLNSLLWYTYCALLLTVPVAGDTSSFIPLIFANRALLLIPFFRSAKADPGLGPAVYILISYSIVFPMLIDFFAGLGSWSIAQRLLEALDDGYAVKALGWDYVICLGSAVVWSQVGKE